MLRQELRQKGVDQQIIQDLLNELDNSSAAMKAAEKKVRSLSRYGEEDFRKKLSGFLQRRGFYYEDIRPVVDELWQRRCESDEGDI